MNFAPYTSPNNDTSLLKNVPIQLLDETLKALRAAYGLKFRVLYRGPRKSEVRDPRSNYSKQSGCLKAYATRFSVYLDTRKAIR